MFDETKDFSEMMAKRRLQLTHPVAEPSIEEVKAEDMPPVSSDPFKRFKKPAEEKAPNMDATALKEFFDASKDYARREIESLRLKVSNADMDTRTRLTERFGYGNEWRAFATRSFLEFYSHVERMEIT